MRKKFLSTVLAGTVALGAMQAHAQETLTTYVNTCKTLLGFNAADVPNMDCYDGDLFDAEPPATDYVGYRKVNDQVDLTFACRWLGGSKADRRGAVSIELNIHNRANGNTCFFSGIATAQFNVPSLIVSPTSAQASSYWHTPAEVDSGVRCIGCHVSGPYISSPKIAPFLAKYGLLNNGHDTLSNMTQADLPLANPNAHAKYHAVGTTFSQWDKLRNTYINGPESASCSMGCHMTGTNSTQDSIVIAPAGTLLAGQDELMLKILAANVMAPSEDYSHYRWINLDTPGDGVEAENYASAKTATSTLVPKLFPASCANPQSLEAHAVGIDNSNSFSTDGMAQITDRLRSFNLKDGVVCLNSDQPNGALCHDYDARYLCPSGTWSPFYNKDTSLADDGDHEERSKSIAQATAFCGGAAPVGIQARVYVTVPNGGTIPIGVYGPNDRLARFSKFGLTCNAADQPDGQCSNYVVRYHGCAAAPPVQTAKHLTSVFTGRQLTATGTANNALTKGQPLTPSWNTQTWDIVPVPNTEYVRLRNTGTNTYLNVTTQAESATVVTYAFNDGYTSEEWTIEPVPNSNDVRLKNLWSGRYLTIGDVANKDYAPVYSQALVIGWTSQRWVIN